MPTTLYYWRFEMCSLSLSCYLRLQPGEKPVQICDLLAPGFGDAGQAEIQDAVFGGHWFFLVGGELCRCDYRARPFALRGGGVPNGAGRIDLAGCRLLSAGRGLRSLPCTELGTLWWRWLTGIPWLSPDLGTWGLQSHPWAVCRGCCGDP